MKPVTRSRSRLSSRPPPSDNNNTQGPAKQKQLTAGEQARQILADAKCLGPEEQVLPNNSFKVLAKIIGKYKNSLGNEAMLALQALVTLLQAADNHEFISNKMMDAIAKRIENKLETVLDGGIGKMSAIVDKVVNNQKELHNTSTAVVEKTVALQKIAQELESRTKETAVTSEQLSNTAASYKEALLTAKNDQQKNRNNQVESYDKDPRLTNDLDRKSKQILLELDKEASPETSVTELKKKIERTLGSMEPAPPAGAKVQEINKLRNGGLIVQLATKEAAE